MASKDPQTVTIYGRLSWPVWTHALAVERNIKSKYPKDAADVRPEFNLVVEPAQLLKLKTHLTDVFLPWCVEQHKAGETRSALDDKQVGKLVALLASEDWDDQPPYIPIKPVPEQTQELAPETVAMVKINGMKGVDIEQKAIVTNEDELKVPDPDQLVFPVIKPIHLTTHQMYSGALVAATLNLYAFVSGKVPGITATASTAVFKADADRFGGGMAVDEDEMFMDD